MINVFSTDWKSTFKENVKSRHTRAHVIELMGDCISNNLPKDSTALVYYNMFTKEPIIVNIVSNSDISSTIDIPDSWVLSYNGVENNLYKCDIVRRELYES